MHEAGRDRLHTAHPGAVLDHSKPPCKSGTWQLDGVMAWISWHVCERGCGSQVCAAKTPNRDTALPVAAL